jgi:two-component sensor histidine kinase
MKELSLSPPSAKQTMPVPVRLRGAEKIWTYLRWLAVGVWWIVLQVSPQPVTQPAANLLFLIGLGYCWLLHSLAHWGRRLHYRFTCAGDVILVALMCGVSGGLHSFAYTYFYGITLAAAIRFGLLEGLGVAAESLLLTGGLFFLLPHTDIQGEELGVRGLLLFLLATLAGVLSYEDKRRSRQAEHDREQAAKLFTLNRTLSSLDLDTLLQRLADTVVRIFPCEGAGLLLLHRHGLQVDRIAVSGSLFVPTEEELQTALTDGVLHEALEQGSLLLHDQAAVQSRLQSSHMKEWAQKNLLVVSIQRHYPVGFLVAVDKSEDGGFTEDDLQLLTIVADQAAVAFEHAWILENTQAVDTERRDLVRAMLKAQEQERKHVVDEWLERFGTKLFQVLRDFRSCQEFMTQRAPEGKERLEHLAAALDELTVMVRSFTNELHPSILDDFGFVAALREYVAGLQDQGAFHVTVEAQESAPPLPSETNLTLFRITQEALRNIRKHARAKNVQIAFVQEHAGVSLMIKDDGQGFDPGRPLDDQYGFLYMREQVEAQGGEFHVQSARGQGTEVRVDLPVGPLHKKPDSARTSYR